MSSPRSPSKLPRLTNVTMKVKEWKGDVVFLHEVAAGAADRSYGIQVAKLAGLPASVIQRAKQVLTMLEKGERGRPVPIIDDLPLFSAKPARGGRRVPSGARRARADQSGRAFAEGGAGEAL